MPSPDVGSAIGRTGVDAADETKGTPRGQPTNRVSSDASASGACTCARQGGGKEADETSSCHRPLLLDRATGYGATATIRRRRAKIPPPRGEVTCVLACALVCALTRAPFHPDRAAALLRLRLSVSRPL